MSGRATWAVAVAIAGISCSGDGLPRLDGPGGVAPAGRQDSDIPIRDATPAPVDAPPPGDGGARDGSATAEAPARPPVDAGGDFLQSPPVGDDGGPADGGSRDADVIDAPNDVVAFPEAGPADLGGGDFSSSSPLALCLHDGYNDLFEIEAIWGASDTNVWTTGRGAVRQWDGTRWNLRLLGSLSHGVWGTGAGEVWMVGEQGEIDYFRGGSDGHSMLLHTQDLRGIGGTSATDLWAVGKKGTVLRNQGAGGWRALPAQSARDLRAVWAVSASEVWAAGDGVILRLEGGGWVSRTDGLAPGALPYLSSLWATGPTDVWAAGRAGGRGVVLHWNGSQWSKVHEAATPLNAVSGRSASDVWVVGDAAVAVQWNGATWTPAPVQTERTLRGVWVSPSGVVWAAGDDQAVVRSCRAR